MKLTIRKYSWQLAPSAVREIRQSVFVGEQAVPPELEWDDTDEISDHFLGLTADGTPVAVARLVPSIPDTGRIGRMAVLKSHRGLGLGEQMLHHLMLEANEQFHEIALSAQTRAIPFYQRSGFHVCSAPYDDAGISHVDMRCLAPARLINVLANTDMAGQAPTTLGSDETMWHVDTETEYRNFTDSLAGQARQRIWLYDRTLDHALYDHQRLRDIFSALARSHRLAEIRLLIHDDKPLVQRRHQLVELLRRLPSKISLRLVSESHPTEEQPFILVDREGVSYRHRFNRPEGWVKFSDSRHVRLLGESYQRMWDTARPSMELRELPL